MIHVQWSQEKLDMNEKALLKAWKCAKICFKSEAEKEFHDEFIWLINSVPGITGLEKRFCMYRNIIKVNNIIGKLVIETWHILNMFCLFHFGLVFVVRYVFFTFELWTESEFSNFNILLV